jgi:uncharacterized protein
MPTEYARWQQTSLERAIATRRVVLLTGARQCGKTTLARRLLPNKARYLTLDDASTRQSALEDPRLFVAPTTGKDTLIIDEVQKAPDLLPAIKQVVDTDNRPGQFLLTGSANVLTLPTVTESLAGRIGKVRLRPLTQGEVLGARPGFLHNAFAQKFAVPAKRYGRDALTDIVFRGGFPEAMRLAGKARRSWHQDYVDALIEHDLKDVANIRHADVMRDLVKVLAAWSSKFMDIAAIGAGLAVDRRTLSGYVAALQAFHLLESVPAWYKTDYDRVGKQSKLFMADTGMMTALLGWRLDSVGTEGEKIGKVFETLAWNELAAQAEAAEDSFTLYQYRDREKREIDLLIEDDAGDLLAVEIKAGLTVRRKDFAHVEWFKSNLAKRRKVTGVMLYAGPEILPFGDNLWAVPFDGLWAW